MILHRFFCEIAGESVIVGLKERFQTQCILHTILVFIVGKSVNLMKRA